MSLTLIRPCAVSICASMPIRPTSRPLAFSIWVSSRSSALTWAASCTFGSMIASRFGAGAADDLEHVLERPLRRPVVDADGADLVAPAALVQRRDDVLAGAGLGQRRAGVLQVEEDLVGGQPLGLLQEPGVAAGDGQVGTTGTKLGHGASACRWSVSYRRVATACRPRRRVPAASLRVVGATGSFRWSARRRRPGDWPAPRAPPRRRPRPSPAGPAAAAPAAGGPAPRSASPAPPAGRRG